MEDFTKLGLKKDVIAALKYKKALPIQSQVIPYILKGKNILFQSQTGSGKTLAFTLGFLSRLNKKQGVQMVVVTPTRELCLQVGREIETVCEPLGIKVGIIFGGRDIKGDHKTYNKKNQVMVVTPGRFVQHVNDKNIKIGEVKFLVYDECDQMFNDQFYSDCVYIRKRVSSIAQVVLASATITPNVKEFVSEFPHEEVLLDKVAENIVQERVKVQIKDKLKLLEVVMNKWKHKKVLIFTNTKIKLFNIIEALEKKFNVGGISSDYTQKEREAVIDKFKRRDITVLVATDVAARGLHIKKVDMVLNYDVPPQPEFYVHRIGRTGRLGKKGYALTFVCPEDEDRMEVIEYMNDLDIKYIDFQ